MRKNRTINEIIEIALDELGASDHNMERSRPYTGQPHTDTGIRGATEIKGITLHFEERLYEKIRQGTDPQMLVHRADVPVRAAEGAAARINCCRREHPERATPKRWHSRFLEVTTR